MCVGGDKSAMEISSSCVTDGGLGEFVVLFGVEVEVAFGVVLVQVLFDVWVVLSVSLLRDVSDVSVVFSCCVTGGVTKSGSDGYCVHGGGTKLFCTKLFFSFLASRTNVSQLNCPNLGFRLSLKMFKKTHLKASKT